MTQVVAQESNHSDAEHAERGGVAREGVRVRLNPFQLLMRRWSKLHPYNAGQVMEVSGGADVERWKGAVSAVLGELGLGAAEFEEGEGVMTFSGGGEVSVVEAEGGLDAFYSEQLNREFLAGEMPIRFAVLRREGSDGHYFAAVYDHWIADSRAMRELMHRIFERYRCGGGKGELAALTLKAPDFRVIFRKHVGRFLWWRALWESAKNIWRHRRGYRINIHQPTNFDSRFFLVELPEGLIGKVHRYAKERSASVNDVFIAALAQTMGEYTSVARNKRRRKWFHFPRNRVGIGTIVDIRDAASESLDQVFNLYLSSYSVLLEGPEKRDLDGLTREVGRTTAKLKRNYSPVKSFWSFDSARRWWDFYREPRDKCRLLHKMVPLVAGISNVNMTRTWADCGEKSEGVHVRNYLRISPTGPLIPLVFTLTTIGGRLNLCVTYRTTSFGEKNARMVTGKFVERLEAVAGS